MNGVAADEVGKRVLVVEDDPDIRDMVGGVLSLEGYDVMSASNGVEALDLLRDKPRPGLILLDLMMPIMNGWELRSELGRNPHLSAIPIVVISGDGSIDRKASALGVNGYLRKPVDLDSLLETVQRFC